MYVIKDGSEFAMPETYIKSVSLIFGSDRSIESSSKSAAKKFKTRKQAAEYMQKYNLVGAIEKA